MSILILASAVLADGAGAQPPQPATAADFMAAAAGAHQYEIMAGRVALIESHDRAIRAFAERMVRDHTAAFDALREAALHAGLAAPSTSVGGDQTMLLAALQGVRGEAFDRAYGRQQVLAHVQALATEGSYARAGADPGLRDVARSDVPMIEGHLQAAERLSSATGT